MFRNCKILLKVDKTVGRAIIFFSAFHNALHIILHDCCADDFKIETQIRLISLFQLSFSMAKKSGFLVKPGSFFIQSNHNHKQASSITFLS